MTAEYKAAGFPNHLTIPTAKPSAISRTGVHDIPRPPLGSGAPRNSFWSFSGGDGPSLTNPTSLNIRTQLRSPRTISGYLAPCHTPPINSRFSCRDR